MMESRLDPDAVAKKFLNCGLNNFSDLKKFLTFCALHPELTIENCALYYAQAGEKAPRFVCHKGIAEMLGIPTNNRIILLSISNDGPAHFVEGAFYPVPEEFEKSLFRDVNIRAVLDRIGYAIIPSADAHSVSVDHDECKISMPTSMSESKQSVVLLNFLVDYFWTALQQRDFVIPTQDEDFQTNLKPVLVFMAGQLLGMKGLYLSKTSYLSLIQQFSPDDMMRGSDVSLRQIRLTQLALLYEELDQVIEGRHFTQYETELFRLSESHPLPHSGGKDIHIGDADKRPFDLYTAYAEYLYRYTAAEKRSFGQINYQRVHIYPPFQYLQKG